MAKLGFLGLGIMGGPMALQLMKAGHEVALWSHSAGKAERLAGGEVKGGTACATPAEVAKRSDFVFLCVGDTEMSREVILGKGGLVEGAQKGMVIADCSTIAPSASRRIGAELAGHGIEFLDAPCTGSKGGAETGTLAFMVGGEKERFERVLPYFKIMGNLVYHCGALGMGLQAKLSQNLIQGNLLQAFNEGMVLSTKGGVDPNLMLEILSNTGAQSKLVSVKAPFVFARDFSTRFSVKWVEKDIALMLESAAELNVPLPLTALSRQLYRAAIAKGFGEDDFCGAIRVLEEIAGCEVAGKPPAKT